MSKNNHELVLGIEPNLSGMLAHACNPSDQVGCAKFEASSVYRASSGPARANIID